MAAPDELRKLPKIDRLLERPQVALWTPRFGRAPSLEALRAAVEAARAKVLAGAACPSEPEIVAAAEAQLERTERPTLRRVINATGVVIHTNLGRAPLSDAAIAAMEAVARGYSNLEFDLEAGERGSRYDHCARLLATLCGAEDALVVNNNAAAVMLALSALARGREVVISRGQLVEIGGGFRIPDVMRESGASLVEVGTTNRTYARDYEAALGERTAALMVVHRSNFTLSGFTCDPELCELAALAHARSVPLLDDLGSGTLLDTAAFALGHEPMVQERVRAGADLVCFSGDKLLGGPQAGYLVGKREIIARLKKFPMLRALRVDKVTLAGIEATLRHYRRGDAAEQIPVWRALAQTCEALDARARGWVRALALPEGRAQVVDARSAVGGGSLPGMSLPTRALALALAAPEAAARELRAQDPPVVGRIEQGLLLLDPRTVRPDEDGALVEAVRRLGAGGG
jgi:L-seryl-tRNA(Ser) seleniumtransferase